MRSATCVLLGALAFVLVGGTAAAQNDVTFQVDMNPYITTCQFDPAANGVTSPGDMNGWNTAEFPLADGDGDGIWTGTFSLPEGPITYKHYVTSSSVLSWENDPNRTYTVTAGAQTIPATAFNGPTPTDACGGVEQDYELTFAVDMSVQIGRGAFDPAVQDVAVAGSFTDWAGSPFILTEDASTSGLYSGTLNLDDVLVPGAFQFKFITRVRADNTVGWESLDPNVTPDQEGGNRVLRLTGSEEDTDSNGRREAFYDNDADPSTFPFFSDADASQFLTGPASVTFNVDMRPARYRIADSGALPVGEGSPAGGNTTIDGVFINGQSAGESQEDGGPSGGIGDWAGWGPVLAAQEGRRLTDPDGDDIWTITLTYAAGARRFPDAKFSVNGADDEAGFQGDHRFTINEGTSTYNLSFGCIRALDGSFRDETGPEGVFSAYDPYLLYDNTATPPTCVVVRNGGEADVTVAVENGPTIAGLELAARPNPVAGRGVVALTLDRAMDVRVRLFDVTGREVATLAEGALAAGTTDVAVDATGLSSGVYVLRVEADGQAATRRLTVVR